jgi:hypothetical protein
MLFSFSLLFRDRRVSIPLPKSFEEVNLLVALDRYRS